jgi:hypothetical protein
MTARSKKKIGYVFCLFIVILYCKGLSAYVLQGPHIIELMTAKLGAAESLFVSQKVVFYITQLEPESVSENEGAEDATAAPNSPDSQQAAPLSDESDVPEPDFMSENDSPGDVKNSANPTGAAGSICFRPCTDRDHSIRRVIAISVFGSLSFRQRL